MDSDASHYDPLLIFETSFFVQCQYLKAIATVASEMVRALSDSLLIPFKVKDYADGLDTKRKALDKDYGAALRLNLDGYGM